MYFDECLFDDGSDTRYGTDEDNQAVWSFRQWVLYVT